MRRQLNWLVLAVTSLVVVAFVVPLGLLVRRQAEERAQVAAEQRAQSAAAALAVAVAGSDPGLDASVAESALVTEVSIVLPNGTVVGVVDVPPSLTAAARRGSPSARYVADGSWLVALPVATSEGFVPVVATASPADLRAGVGQATALLAALAVALVIGSVWLADRLGRRLVQPMGRLAGVAIRLGDGDLEARAGNEGPEEVRRVATALNTLAARLADIISGEREALADLSHRLRTPLTSLRLQAERVADPEDRSRLVAQVDRAQRAVDQLITDVRNRGREATAPASDLTAVVAERARFWSLLADEEERRLEVKVPDEPVLVAAPKAEVAAAVDALLGNVFSHTPAGVEFSIEVSTDHGFSSLTVADAGPGFDPAMPVTIRGASGAGSTGLGLDIARRLAERLGGTLQTGEGPLGGALVRLRWGTD